MARIRPYDPRVFKTDSQKAETSLKKYVRPSRTRPRQIYIVGQCPRCGHDMDYKRQLKVAAPRFDFDRPADTGPLPPIDQAFDAEFEHTEQQFTVQCDCEVAHPKTPEGKNGCGSKFTVRVKW